MSDTDFRTVQLRGCLDRMRAGDHSARDELVRAAQDRLELLSRRMLRRFPNVHRWADTGDIFQGAVMRLLRTLDNLRPNDTREFFNLAAAHIRRELIDLARRYGGPQGLGANHVSVGSAGVDGQATDADPESLDRWTAFHRAVEGLPAEDREVFGLTFYHGWTQQQVAELLGISERTIRRRWGAACLALNEALGGDLPGL